MDHHHDIPRDAEGDPVFLILPAPMRADYEKVMANCEAAWRAGEPLAVAEAATCVHLYRQPIPKWLEQAIVELAINQRTKQQAKHYTEAQLQLRRYMTVRDLKLDINFSQETAKRIADISWEEAYERAAEILAGTSAAGSAATMKADYQKVQRNLNAGHGGKYFVLKDRRYRLNGKPDPSGQSKAPLA
jgi:hypothetical protein